MKKGTICNILGEGDDIFIVCDVSENSVLVEQCFKKSIPCWESKSKIKVVSVSDIKKRMQYFEKQINYINEGIKLCKVYLNK